jgi:hypothetical protein
LPWLAARRRFTPRPGALLRSSRIATAGFQNSVLDRRHPVEVVETEIGRPGEWHVVKVLVQALCARGHTASLLGGAQDGRGEDGRISLNNRTFSVQVVSVPTEPKIWRELAQRSSTAASGTLDDAVKMFRAAFEKKRNLAKGTILVLDTTHIGAVVTRRLLEAYQQTHGDPVAEFELRDAWAIGPTVRSSFQFAVPVEARR